MNKKATIITQSPYPEFKERFKNMNDADLLKALKEQIGKPGWVKAREYYMYYLHEEIKSRGLDSDN